MQQFESVQQECSAIKQRAEKLNEIEAYEKGYQEQVNSIMNIISTLNVTFQNEDELALMKERYMEDLKSLDSAREGFHDRMKLDEQNESPEMG